MVKRSIYTLIFAIAVSSCIFPQVEPKIMEIAPDEIIFTADKQDELVSVNCDFEWNASLATGEWFSIKCTYPQEPETIGSITVSSKFNYNDADRIDTLIVTSGSKVINVPITQKGTGSIISQREVRISDTREATVVIDTKQSWSISADMDNKGKLPSWFEITPSSGGPGKNTITVKAIEQHIDVGDREAAINFLIGDAIIKGKIIQSQTDVIFLESNSINLDYDQSLFDIPLQTNIEYKFSIDDDSRSWISYVDTKALNSYTVTFRVAENDDVEPRTGIIHFTSGDIDESFIVTQDGARNNYGKISAYGVYNLGGQDWAEVKNVTQNSIVDYGDHYSSHLINPKEQSVVEFTNLKKTYYQSEPVNIRVNIYSNSMTFSAIYNTKVYKYSESTLWLKTSDDVWFIIKRK